MQSFTPIFITTIAIATAMNIVLKRVNMPTIIGYIITGVIVGNLFGISLQDNQSLEHIAEFGVVFLMFTIGLEFSVSHLVSMRREVFLFGMLQVILTGAILAILIQLCFDIPYKSAIIMGAGLALSSTAIVLKVLNESGKIKTGYGHNAVGILIFQDIAVIPILLMITIFTREDKSLAELLTETAINAMITLGMLIVIGKFLLGHLFKTVSNADSKEIYMGSILLTVVGASYIAHSFGFSYSLGGFIAGTMIADTIYKYQVEADLIPFRDLLLGVFFVTVGLQIDFDVVIDNILSVGMICLGVMFIKTTITFAILVYTSGNKTALKTAITLSQIGEFTLVVFSLLLVNKMLDPTLVQIVMVAIVLSMIITPLLLNNLDAIVGLFIKGEIEKDSLDQASVIGGHVILCGYGAFGRVVSDMLDKADINHVIVTNNTEGYVRAKEARKSVVFGDSSDRVLLNRLQIKDAMNTILALDDFEEVQQASAAITLISPDIPVIAKVPTEEECHLLEEFNHELLLDGNTHTAAVLTDQLIRSRLLALETSKLQFLHNYSLHQPTQAIKKIEQEQARLLEIMVTSFNGLRENKDIMEIKALHDSFKVLCEIIGDAICKAMENPKLSHNEYERLNILLDNQHQLISMNEALEDLGQELKALAMNEQTRRLSETAVEGMDTILLTLIDLAKTCDDEEMAMFRCMTSGETSGLASIREKYLGPKADLDTETKALLFSSTNHMDRLKSLFGLVGENYRKLAFGTEPKR